MNVMPRSDATHAAYQQRERFWGAVAPIIEAWRLAILVPLLLGLSAFAYLYSMTTFRSESILRLDPDEVAILKSDRVLATAIDKAVVSGAARKASDVSLDVFHLSNDSDLYKLSLYLRSAGGADVVLGEIVNALMDATKPNKERAELLNSHLGVLKQQKELLSSSLDRINRAYDNVPSQGGASSVGASQPGYVGEPFSVLVGELAKTQMAIANSEGLMKGTFTGVDVVMAPTEASRSPNTIGPFVTLAVVIGLALVSIFALVRDAWLRASDSPNVTRIRGAFFSRQHQQHP